MPRPPLDWRLPLAVALLPALAAHLAYALSVREGFVPACLPYWDGCTSISRAARHGEANLLFKAVMLPCALLLAWLWRDARRWLARRGADPGARLVAYGLVGALLLALYVAMLGVDLRAAQGLRRLGALGYFAATYLAQLHLVRALWRSGARDAATRALLATSLLLLMLGLASTAASTFVTEAGLKDRIENAIEWQLGALFTLWFALLAWRRRADGSPRQLVPANTRAPPPPRSG